MSFTSEQLNVAKNILRENAFKPANEYVLNEELSKNNVNLASKEIKQLFNQVLKSLEEETKSTSSLNLVFRTANNNVTLNLDAESKESLKDLFQNTSVSVKPESPTTLKIRLSEEVNPPFIYIGPDNVVHLLIPISSGDDIGLDNTCRATDSTKEFLGIASDSQIKKNSALHVLTRYRLELLDDINELLENHEEEEATLARDRLNQAEAYISTLESIRNNSFSSSSQILQDLSDSEESNLHALQIIPHTSPSSNLRSKKPLFSINRTNAQFYNLLVEEYNRLHQFTPLNNLTRLREQIKIKLNNPQPPIALSRALLNQILEAMKESNSFLNTEADSLSIEKLYTLATITFGPEEEGNQNGWASDPLDNDQFNSLLETLITQSQPNFSPEEVSLEEFIPTTSLAQSKGTLNTLTQFFLGEINLYAHNRNLLTAKRTNFGDILENNSVLAKKFAKAITRSIHDFHSIEDTIINFINNHTQEFKLKAPIEVQHKNKILKNFRAHYSTVNTALHLVEFLILDKERKNNALFFQYDGNISVDFTSYLEKHPNHFNLGPFQRAIAQKKQLPASLVKRETSSLPHIELSIDAIKARIISSIENRDRKQLKILLAKTEDNRSVFEQLDTEFFSQFQSNPAAQELFLEVRSAIRDAATSNKFNHTVLGQNAQLVLTSEMARCIYVAVQDRQELPLEEVLQYNNPEALTKLINNLIKLAEENNPYSQQYRLINKNFRISQNDDGTMVIDNVNQATIDAIQQIVTEYSNAIHVALVMSSSLYKQAEEDLGSDNPDYRFMNEELKNNNLDDPDNDHVPHKFLRALELLGIRVNPEDVRYNNTLNEHPYLSHANKNNPHIRKKGGSGFIITNISPADLFLIQEITEHQANRFVCQPLFLEALERQIRHLGEGHLLDQTKPMAERIEDALVLLRIPYRRVESGATPQDNCTIYLEQKEQAKIKFITKRFYQLPDSIPFNKEDEQYTRNYQPRLIYDPRGQLTQARLVELLKTENRLSEDLPFAPVLPTRHETATQGQTTTNEPSTNRVQQTEPQERLVLTPQMARSLYVAVQDRRELPVDRVLKYNTVDDIRSILAYLHALGIGPNVPPQSAEYAQIRNCEVTQDENGQIVINAPLSSIRTLRGITDIYQNSIHLAILMSSGIYKQVVQQYGLNSPEVKEMQSLNNNTPGDPTPYKLLRALELLNIDVRRPLPGDLTASVRYNNTVNNLPYKTHNNAGQPVKGGSGFIIDGLSEENIARIEQITEDQAYRMVLDPFFELAIMDKISELGAEDLLQPYKEDRHLRLQAALLLLGIEHRQLTFDNTHDVFYIELEPANQAKIKWILDKTFPGQVHASISIFNNEDKQYTQHYSPSLARPRSDIPRYLEQKLAEYQHPKDPYPLVLPYHRPVAQTQANTQSRPVAATKMVPPVVTPTPSSAIIQPINNINNPPPLTSVSTNSTVRTQPPVRRTYNNELSHLIYDLLDNLEEHGSNGFWPFIDKKTFKQDKLNEMLLWVRNNEVDANNKDQVLNVIRDICKIKRNFFGLFAPNSLTFFNKLLLERQSQFGQCIFRADYSKKQLKQRTIHSLLPQSNANPSVRRNEQALATTSNEAQEERAQLERERRRVREEQERIRLREQLDQRRQTQPTISGLNQFFDNLDTIERERQRAEEERIQREQAAINRGGS